MEYLIAFWIVCSVVTYGYSFGYFRNKYGFEDTYKSDVITCLIGSCGGPLSILAYFVAIGKKGFKYGFRIR